jgi:hypothetical protein
VLEMFNFILISIQVYNDGHHHGKNHMQMNIIIMNIENLEWESLKKEHHLQQIDRVL